MMNRKRMIFRQIHDIPTPKWRNDENMTKNTKINLQNWKTNAYI